MRLPGFDIFCRVVDNYGDVGVCWRLARQLARHPAVGVVRLWVDNLAAFHRIETRVDATAAQQLHCSVEIRHWVDPLPDVPPLDVVVEAFACDLPPMFRKRMTDSLWINLEYLSAEDWVEGCHALPSLQPDGQSKFFFFPGFTKNTGGLLREPDLLASQASWAASPDLRWTLLGKIGMPQPLQQLLQRGWRQAFIFCYDDAPAQALAHALSRPSHPTLAIVPQGVLSKLSAFQTDFFRVFESPFVDQDDFDRLLWSSDLNIVRGEDSLIRAIWAGKPFLWHIYRQEDEAHLVKLDAWLARTGFNPLTQQTIRAFNEANASLTTAHLQEALEPATWARWQQDCLSYRHALMREECLVTRLLAFCAEKAHSG